MYKILYLPTGEYLLRPMSGLTAQYNKSIGVRYDTPIDYGFTTRESAEDYVRCLVVNRSNIDDIDEEPAFLFGQYHIEDISGI